MAEIAVEYLVARLEDWIFKETNKKRAAEVTKLKTEFDRVRPFLKYADWRWMIMEDKVFQTWVSGVIDLAREVENVIDNDCYNKRDTTEYSMSSLVQLLGDSLNYFTEGKIKDNSHINIAFLLKRVTEKLKEVEIRKAIPLFSSMEEARDERRMWHSESFTHKFPSTHMVGRKKEIGILEEWLLKEDVDTPLLVAVTGISGIGKTAISTTVFKCIKIYFDCASWVFVSARPTIDILREMFLGFTRTPFEKRGQRYLAEMDEEELTKRINDYLAGKNFLLVIDELDTLDTWENLRCALPLKCRGKVLMNTRNSEFPAALCNHILHLEPLSNKDASELMRRRAYWRHSDLEVTWPSSVGPTVEKILQICGGNPLLVATVGGMLSTVNIDEPKEWDKILGMLNAAGDYLPHFNMIQKVLIVSYFSLPPMLKCCLLSCGIFPSHYEISCKRLIRIWVAEGFISRQTLGMTEEEIGKHLLDDLIQRNLLEIASVGADGEVVSCRLLWLMQEFILKTMNKGYFCIMSNKRPHILPSEGTRILAINGLINNFPPLRNTTPIRSLLLFRENGLWTPVVFTNSSSNIKFLRVLELQNSPFDALPDAVGDLVLLRYMNLKGTKINNLPSTLKSLHELQTLDIRDTCVRALPGGIDGLKMLRHLFLADSCSNRVVKLDGDIMFYKDLQTLKGIKLTQQIAFGLGYLPQLLRLTVGEVEGRGTSLQLSKSIDLMKNLSSLTIKCAWRKEIQLQTSNPLENLEKLRVGGWIKNLLGWVCTLKSVKYLYLQDCSLTDDPISSLQYLPSLTVLSLCNAYKGNLMCSDDAGGFPNLKELSILKLAELEEWTRIEEGSMKDLHTIIIAKCPRLKMPPKGLQNLTNLQVMQVKNMPAEFIRETRELPLHSGVHFSVA